MPDLPTQIAPPERLRDQQPPRAGPVTTPADLDRLPHAWQSRFTGGRSPSTVSLAFQDWAAHAMNAPFQTAALGLPIFMVGTERDHIAPWHSVFKLHLLNDGELIFVLTSLGHNAGIVSEPGHPRRHFRFRVRDAGARTLGPDEWERDTAPQDGSWWPAWAAWLDRNAGPRVDPPPMGSAGFSALCDAPGTYVLEA
jgi:hypothetical protein